MLDDDTLVLHLIWREHSSDGTCFRDIRQVPPGHTMVFENETMRVFRHWHPPAELVRLPRTADYHEELRRLFRVAVARRLRSDRPVLVHVSGGIDSSSIACMVDEIRRDATLPCPEVRGVSSLYPGLACDESPYIDAVAAHVGFPIERWDGTLVEPIDLIAPSPVMPGGRVSNTSGSLGDVEIAHRSRAKVILSGLGGDQLGASSGIVVDLLKTGQWALATDRYLDLPDPTLRRRWARAMSLLKQLLPRSMLGSLTLARPRLPRWLTLTAHLRGRRGLWPRAPGVHFASAVQERHWEWLWSQQMMGALTADDLVGRAHDVEYRYPFLDSELVSFVLAIPAEHWQLGPYARIHREAMRQALPAAVADRYGKADFTPALANRITRASTEIRELLFGSRWESERYVRQRGAQALGRDVLAAPDRADSLQCRYLWNVAVLEAWLRAGLR